MKKRVDHALAAITKKVEKGEQPTAQEVTAAIATTKGDVMKQYGLKDDDATALLNFSFDMRELTQREANETIALVTDIIPADDDFGKRLADLVELAVPPHYREYKVWYKGHIAGLTVLGLNEVEADFVIGNAQAVAQQFGLVPTELIDNCKKLIANGEKIDDVMVLIRKAIQIGQLNENKGIVLPK